MALRHRAFLCALPDLWHWQAATLTAGASLRWLRDEVLGGGYSYQGLADAAAASSRARKVCYFIHISQASAPRI